MKNKSIKRKKPTKWSSITLTMKIGDAIEDYCEASPMPKKEILRSVERVPLLLKIREERKEREEKIRKRKKR